MSDLISRVDAIEAIASRDETDGTVKVFTGREVNEILESIPSAEVVLQTPQTYGKSINPNTEIISDLISRQDAIKIEAVGTIKEQIESLPSAEPKTWWIPVSEKPKDEERTYLVQLDGGGMCSCRWTNANPFWTELTTDWHWNIFDIPQYCKVVAWMDLEPYREDGEA